MRAKFAERFPRYALLMPSWEPSGAVSEEVPDLSAIPLAHAEVVYIFGIGSTYDTLKSWLHEKKERRLIFFEFETSILARFLETERAKEIVDDEQVEIALLPTGRGQTALLQEFAERYPVRGVYVAALPSLKRRSARLSLQLLRKTAMTHCMFIEQVHGSSILGNFLQNVRHLPHSFYANRLRFENIPAVICGAGPSLAASFDMLRQLEHRALIIAGGSAIAALAAQGIKPHFAIAIDPNPEEEDRLRNNLPPEVPLLYTTRLYPTCIAACKGPLGYIRSAMSGLAEIWMEEELGLKDPLPTKHLPPESLSVTTLAAAMAAHFGCNPIVFDGLDLAYTGNKRYAQGVGAHGDEKENTMPWDRLLSKRDKKGQPVQSAVRWVMEANSLSRFAKRMPNHRWINATAGGLGLKGIESLPLSQISADWPSRDLRSLVHQACLKAAFPASLQTTIEEKTKELYRSVEAVLHHLEILIAESEKILHDPRETTGLMALAELELKEELASSILFLDMEETLGRELARSQPLHTKAGRLAYWKGYHQIALKAKQAFS